MKQLWQEMQDADHDLSDLCNLFNSDDDDENLMDLPEFYQTLVNRCEPNAVTQRWSERNSFGIMNLRQLSSAVLGFLGTKTQPDRALVQAMRRIKIRLLHKIGREILDVASQTPLPSSNNDRNNVK